jgi:hypothetical protein
MREEYEFRINSRFVDRLFKRDEGRDLGDVRVVKLSQSDPRLSQIAVLENEITSTTNLGFYYGWNIRRFYTVKELDAGRMFNLRFKKVFEPCGEQCGTIYDESTACQYCGAGATQTNALHLDLKKIPSTKDIARTIAGEIVVSRRMASILLDGQFRGFRLSPIRSKSLRRRDLVERDEVSSTCAEKSGNGLPHGTWFQLLATVRVDIVDPTRVGIDPLKDDAKSEYRCVHGDTIGLNLLSELWLSTRDVGDFDIAFTAQYIGVRRGVLRPEPLLVISQRLRQALLQHQITGYRLEIAHHQDEN